ncbi:MAG: hypothetical protein PHT84_04605 [Candidatus Pacebacteria bacterium]|nr:hypothetical protein [Candidatus Paceibacterota bacterium]
MKSTWTTPVGCDKVLDSYYAGYYTNGYQYGYTNNTPAYNPNYSTRTYGSGSQVSTTKTPVVNNYYYQTLPITTNKQVASASTTTKTTSSTSTQAKSNTSTKASSASKTTSDDISNVSGAQGFNNGLTAMSYTGQNVFFPNSFWHWLIVIFLILVIVILTRMIARTPRKEVHTVKAHA